MPSHAAGSRQEPPAPSDAASTGLEMPEWMELGAQWHKAVSARDCAFQSYKAEDYEAAEQWYSYAVDAMAALARDSRLESAARADIATVPGWSGVTPPPCAEEVSLHLSRTLSNRSAARLMRGRPWEALLDAMDALQVDEKNVRARVRVGTCFLRVGLMGRAREVLEECMSVQAGDGAAAKAKEEAEQRLRELGKAQVSWRRVARSSYATDRRESRGYLVAAPCRVLSGLSSSGLSGTASWA